MKIRKINEQFGIEIDFEGMTPNINYLASFTKEKLVSDGVVLYRNMDMSVGQYLEFGRSMGRIRPFVDENYQHPEYPEIFVVSNKKTPDTQFGMDRIGYYWHSDSSFLPDPLPISALYAQVVPKVGGETAFIDMTEAYVKVDNSHLDEVKGKSALHEGKWKYMVTDNDVGYSLEELLDRDEKALPAPEHPIVFRHPFNGKMCLYLTEGISRSIVQIPDLEGQQVIAKIWSQILATCTQYKHNWCNRDMVLWDNRRMIHQAYPSTDGSPRMLYRLGIEDQEFFLPTMKV